VARVKVRCNVSCLNEPLASDSIDGSISCGFIVILLYNLMADVPAAHR